MIEGLKNSFLVLLKPGKVFSDLEGRKVSWWAPALILLSTVTLAQPLLTLPAMQAQSKKIIQAQIKQMEIDEEKGKTPKLPPEAKAQMKKSARDGVPTAMLIVGGAFGAVGIWAGAALSALIVMVLVKLFKGAVSYQTGLVLVALAFMPFFIGEGLRILSTLATGNFPLGTGMSALILPDPTKAALTPITQGVGFTLALVTLSRIDIFVVWSLVLLAAGVIRVGGVAKAGGAGVALSYWLLTWAIAAVPALISIALMPGIAQAG